MSNNIAHSFYLTPWCARVLFSKIICELSGKFTYLQYTHSRCIAINFVRAKIIIAISETTNSFFNLLTVINYML